MKLEQFVQGLKDKSIAIDTCGHDINVNYVLAEMLNKLSSVVFSKYWVDRDNPAQNILFFNFCQCYRCGQYLEWSFSQNSLKLNRLIGTDTCHPEGYRCELENVKPFVGKITINSNLIVANYFNNVVPELSDVEQCEKYYINILKGRYNLAEYMSFHNVAYGQMGNMSIGVFVHPDKKSIIIGDHFYSEELDDYTNEIEGHIYKGSVCLDVWRWEATDLNTIGDNQYNVDNSVECDVEHGVWRFEHFYDMHRENECEDESPIYSKFTLIEDRIDKTPTIY